MRVALPLIALMLATGASAAPEAVPPEPAPGAKSAQADPKAVCSDRIHMVRQQRGLPTFQRDTATSEEPLLIYAVDKRIDGCSVMVMAYNAQDIRPLPNAQGEPRLRKIQ